MSLTTFTPPVPPVVGTSERKEIKLLRADFGDGYSAITRDGLNHIRRVITLRWEALDADDAAAIDDFLTLRGGSDPFYFVAPGKPAPMKWTCDDWTMTLGSGGFASIDATFRQSFSLAS